jgi:K+ transporter
MPLAFGGHFVFQQLEKGGWIAVVAALAMVVLVIYWSRITTWIERRWPFR